MPPNPSSFPASSLDAVQGRLVRGPRAKHTLRHSCVAGLDVRCDIVPSSGTGRRPHAQSGVRASGRWPASAVATASDHRVYPFPHTLGAPVGMCTRRDCGKLVS